MVGHCKDCRYFERYSFHWDNKRGDCEMHGPYGKQDSLVCTNSDEDQLTVHEDFGCVQFAPREEEETDG